MPFVAWLTAIQSSDCPHPQAGSARPYPVPGLRPEGGRGCPQTSESVYG